MAEKTIDKYKTGIIAVIMFMAGLGGGVSIDGEQVFLTQEQIDNSYVCTTTQKLAICPGTETHPDPLSPSGASCYFNNGEKDTYTRCSKGTFIPLTEAAEQKGVSISQYLQSSINTPEPEPEYKPPSKHTGNQEICTPEGCTDINE